MSKPVVWLGVNMPPAALAWLEDNAEVIGPRDDPTPPELYDGLDDAIAGIVGPLFPGTHAAFAQLPHLRVVARSGAGYDNIDVAAATAHGLCVLRTPDANTETTAVFTIGMMLSAVRRLKMGNQLLAAGHWLPLPELTTFDLNGNTLGIVGLGRIGARVAEIANVLGLHVLAYDPYISEGRATSFRTRLVPELKMLLNEADIVTLHVPLTDETRKMIGPAELAQMKRGAILVNCARGPVLDEPALAEALNSGHLAGAALDVWDPEPPALDNPLLHMDNVIATPHIASKTQEGQFRSRISAAKQTILALKGQKPPGLVNPEVWDVRRGR
jgi:D-3-phosphoglycerate dehydrogenase